MAEPYLHERTLVATLRGATVPDADRARLDQHALLDLIERHRLAGVVRRHVQAAEDGHWASALEEALVTASRKTLADNMVLVEALRSIEEVLRAADISFVVLKGASLLGFLYPEFDGRFMTDLDLLIRQDDWPRVAAALRTRGYKMPTGEQERYYSQAWYHQLVETPAFPSCAVEFHWNIESTERSRVDPVDLANRSVAFELDDTSYRRLCDDDLLLHLAVHLAHHFDRPSLHWVEDLRRLLLNSTFDWAVIESRARQWQVLNCLAYTFCYVERVFPGTLPPAARRIVLSPARRFVLQLLGTTDPTLPHRPLADKPLRHAVSMALLDRWWDALRYVAKHTILRLGRPLRLARRSPDETPR